MNPERWRQVEKLFEEALNQAPGERLRWLEEACSGDAALFQEVSGMLAADAQGSLVHEKVQEAVAAFAAGESAPIGRAGAYRLTKELGRGGMGTVYLGQRADGQYDAEVAVKLIRAGMDSAFFLERFASERQALARLQHPNIARIFDSGTTDEGWPYIVMELVRGVPITTYVREKGLTFDQILTLYLEVCRAVSHAHQKFVVHRDIKPGNILVQEDGTPKLLDFGICKLLEDSPRTSETLSGVALMTPEYASPEQVRGTPVTVGSDIYSLGAILYELLTGRAPGMRETLVPPSHLAHLVEAAGLLDQVVLKALHQDVDHRYESVERFAEDLRRVLNREQALLEAEPPPSGRPHWRTRRWAMVAAAACLAGGGWYFRSRPAEHLDVESVPGFLEAHRLMKVHGKNETLAESLARSERAIALFEQAARERPRSARILAGLAAAYEGIADLAPDQFYRYMGLAKKAAERGLQIDDRQDELHYVLGSAQLFGTWELERALASFRRAVELNPQHGQAHRLRADVLCMFGRFKEALASLSAAQAVTPLDTEVGGEKAAVYFRWRRFAQAAETARQTLAIEPEDMMARWVLGVALQHQGNLTEAEKILRALPPRPVRNPLALAHLLAMTGRTGEARELVEASHRRASNPSAEALIYAAIGDRNTALRLLDQGVAERDINLLYITMDPRYDVLRSEPRFFQISKQLGIPHAP